MVSLASTATEAIDETRAIRAWLYFLCLMIFAMILVGGATRLTDSGLSITEWKPILGIIPPLSEADWQEALAKYRLIPEYQLVNKGMSLEEFKFIYWWEWGHRFLGRMIGFAFLIPFLFFWLTGRISRELMPKLIAMFILGGLQGALGWYMVASGLTDRVDVSQYRLAAHLCAAIVILGYIYWVALDLRGARAPARDAGQGLRLSAIGLTLAIFFQIALGAFVAGIDAGLASDTWPLMHGALIPDGLNVLSPWYLNLFENPLTVQFDHRMVAYALTVWVLFHAIAVQRRFGAGTVSRASGLIGLMVIVQIVLGIWTVMAHVPLSAALLHQGGAVVLFVIALHHVYQLRQSARAAAAV